MQLNGIDLKSMVIFQVTFLIKLSTQFVMLIMSFAMKNIYQIDLKMQNRTLCSVRFWIPMKSKWCTTMDYMDVKTWRQMDCLEVNCTDNLNLCLWVYVQRLNCSSCTLIPETSCMSSRKTVTHVICNTHRIHNNRRDIWERGKFQGKFLGSR